MDAAAEPVRFDTKIAVLLRDDLEVWQRLNVTSFLVSAIDTAAGLVAESERSVRTAKEEVEEMAR